MRRLPFLFAVAGRRTSYDRCVALESLSPRILLAADFDASQRIGDDSTEQRTAEDRLANSARAMSPIGATAADAALELNSTATGITGPIGELHMPGAEFEYATAAPGPWLDEVALRTLNADRSADVSSADQQSDPLSLDESTSHAPTQNDGAGSYTGPALAEAADVGQVTEAHVEWTHTEQPELNVGQWHKNKNLSTLRTLGELAAILRDHGVG